MGRPFDDLTGRTFGRWTVLWRIESDKRGKAWFRCRCVCGVERDVEGAKLTKKTRPSRSCGCLRKERLHDLTGRRFGRWIVIGRAKNRRGQTYWHCKCDCGGEKDVFAGHLIDGESRSCGCLSRETTAQRSTKHGHSHRGKHSREYKSLHGAIQRCFNSNHPRYSDYGGRLDPPMCGRYRFGENGMSNVECLIADIGHCPAGKTLGRINNDLGYIVGNVRWEMDEQQQNNRRNNLRWTLGNRMQTKAQWLREWGWPRYKFDSRVRDLNRRLNRITRTIPPPIVGEANHTALTVKSLRAAAFPQSTVMAHLIRWHKRRLIELVWKAPRLGTEGTQR
jgi:hypothetical protein